MALILASKAACLGLPRGPLFLCWWRDVVQVQRRSEEWPSGVSIYVAAHTSRTLAKRPVASLQRQRPTATTYRAAWPSSDDGRSSSSCRSVPRSWPTSNNSTRQLGVMTTTHCRTWRSLEWRGCKDEVAGVTGERGSSIRAGSAELSGRRSVRYQRRMSVVMQFWASAAGTRLGRKFLNFAY